MRELVEGGKGRKRKPQCAGRQGREREKESVTLALGIAAASAATDEEGIIITTTTATLPVAAVVVVVVDDNDDHQH